MSYRLCIILKTSIILPRRCLYDNEGSFNNFNLSIKVKFLIPGNSFVALLWTFSTAIMFFCKDTIQLWHSQDACDGARGL